MDPHDQELLKKQLRGIGVKRNDGVMILMLVAVFLAGITFGGFLFGHDDGLIRIASKELLPIGGPGPENTLQ